jgi:carbonic anhydrase/acetyltransferase-like protein (isoleucine patch superfamily)
VSLRHPGLHPLGYPAVRPNLPVLPYGANKAATFIDPTVGITHGVHVIVGSHTLVAPYARLSAVTGLIKIGSGSAILDNATILSNPTHARRPTTSVLIGDFVSIGYGATVLGPSTIGAFGSSSQPASVGANALIDGATVEPGAIVGPLARVGPGVTVPSGMYVKPGANVTTNAEASNPALGKVTPVTASQLSSLTQQLLNDQALALGYTTLYQGDADTGGSMGVAPTVKGVHNGYLPAVEGASSEPGSGNGVPFEPKDPIAPTFLSPQGQQAPGLLFNFPARIIGQANFFQRAGTVAGSLGRGDSIRADQGQPITFGSSLKLGNNVTIISPLDAASASKQGKVTLYDNFQAGDNAVIAGGPKVNIAIGPNASIGAGAVVLRSSLGLGSTVGDRAYVADSNLPARSVVPAGAIIINNVQVGTVQWA